MQFGDSSTCRSCRQRCQRCQCCKMHLQQPQTALKLYLARGTRQRCVYQVNQLTTGYSTIYIYLLSLSTPLLPSLSPSLTAHYALINWNNFGSVGATTVSLARLGLAWLDDCISNEEALLRYIIDSIFLFAFMLALIFHSHQTEATYRLDFIWKLQATGEL